MRLLNVYSLELEEFIGETVPPYFILSHRWCGKEITYKDFVKGRLVSTPGYQKIERFCAFIRTQIEHSELRAVFGDTAVEWVWIDTCCIDKRSSAELSEAINSMFQWYKGSVACFVYLNDVAVTSVDQDQRHSFLESSWFLRGWTLQELLAPERIVFCNVHWKVIGCMSMPGNWQAKSAREAQFEASYAPSLTREVAYTTGIRHTYLCGRYRSGSNHTSIAERFAWAAKRRTTRVEDEAYCLLGLFDVNMPLLYGEGSKAFLRLQQAIVRQSTDKSLFAWKLANGSGTSCERLFAQSPRYFAISQNQAYIIDTYDDGLDATLTSRGLHLRAQSVRVSSQEFNAKVRSIGGGSVVETEADVFFLSFEYSEFTWPQPLPLVLALAKRDDVRQPNQYVRICTDDLGEKFQELFSLSDRAIEPEQSFFIDT